MKTNLIALFVLLAFPCTVYSDTPDKTLHSQCLYPTIKVVSGESAGSGTGFIVRSEKTYDGKYGNVAITCAHVLTGGLYYAGVPSYEDWSILKSYQMYPIYSHLIDQQNDLAIIVFKTDSQMPTVELDFDSKLYIGSDIFRIGCGLSDDPRLDYGKITSVGKDYFRTSVFTLPGDSGGPVFHKNKVIAFIRAIRTIKTKENAMNHIYNVSYGVRLNVLKEIDNNLDNSLDFIYDDSKSIPLISFFLLDMRRSSLNIDNISQNKWIKGF